MRFEVAQEGLDAVDHLRRDSRGPVDEPIPRVRVRRQLRAGHEQLALKAEDHRRQVAESGRQRPEATLDPELRRNGYGLTELIKDHPELRRVGVAAAYAFAANNRDRYAEFFEPDGALAGPGYTEDEAAGLPEQYRVPGVVIKPRAVATT